MCGERASEKNENEVKDRVMLMEGGGEESDVLKSRPIRMRAQTWYEILSKRSHIYSWNISVSLFLAALLAWSIAGGMKCLEGVGISSCSAGMLDQSLTRTRLLLSPSPSRGLALERNQRNILDVQNTTSLMREIHERFQLTVAEQQYCLPDERILCSFIRSFFKEAFYCLQ